MITKKAQYHLKSYFLEIFKFLYFLPPFFFLPVGHCFTGWSKINLKVYDVINCLSKNLITHFVWYLEKEIRYDIETLCIDRVLNIELFYEKSCKKCVPKASPRPFIILLNNPKQRLHARCSFTNKIFWKRII